MISSHISPFDARCWLPRLSPSHFSGCPREHKGEPRSSPSTVSVTLTVTTFSKPVFHPSYPFYLETMILQFPVKEIKIQSLSEHTPVLYFWPCIAGPTFKNLLWWLAWVSLSIFVCIFYTKRMGKPNCITAALCTPLTACGVSMSGLTCSVD